MLSNWQFPPNFWMLLVVWGGLALVAVLGWLIDRLLKRRSANRLAAAMLTTRLPWATRRKPNFRRRRTRR